MGMVRDCRELRVCQRGFAAAQRIYELSKRFPPEERYSLTDQIRRTSRLVCTNIGEAWRKRCYPAAFVSKKGPLPSRRHTMLGWLPITIQSAGVTTRGRCRSSKSSSRPRRPAPTCCDACDGRMAFCALPATGIRPGQQPEVNFGAWHASGGRLRLREQSPRGRASRCDCGFGPSGSWRIRSSVGAPWASIASSARIQALSVTNIWTTTSTSSRSASTVGIPGLAVSSFTGWFSRPRRSPPCPIARSSTRNPRSSRYEREVDTPL